MPNQQPNLFQNANQPMQLTTVQDAINTIKNDIENAIIANGVTGKNNLIRTQLPINLLHNVVKAELIRKGINPMRIKPAYGVSTGECALAGALKRKKQDISVFPNNRVQQREIITSDGLLKDEADKYGFNLTEATLTINVRSQLSSSGKNFDTLYERTFAEPLNFHLRCPNMVLGELYMITVRDYDDSAANNNTIAFKNTNVQKHIKKYISAFQALNNRANSNDIKYKYERVCLLIVDFQQQIPKIYNTTAELIADGLLPQNTPFTIDNMNFPTFIDSLLSTYQTRFGANRFT